MGVSMASPSPWLDGRVCREASSIYRHQQELEEALAQERAARETERLAKEAERLAKEAERQAKEAECQAKEAALAEVARLQALLRASRPQGDA